MSGRRPAKHQTCVYVYIYEGCAIADGHGSAPEFRITKLSREREEEGTSYQFPALGELHAAAVSSLFLVFRYGMYYIAYIFFKGRRGSI